MTRRLPWDAALCVVGGVAFGLTAFLILTLEGPGKVGPPPPVPTVTATVTAPPVTMPPRTVYVERPSRSERRVALDLRRLPLWEAIAECESSGRWSLDTGLYDGGLQFLPSTWRAHGGTDFAPTANLATKAEQITVANRASKGGSWLAPWPVCGKRAAARFGMEFP